MAASGKAYLCGYRMIAMLRFWLVFSFFFFLFVTCYLLAEISTSCYLLALICLSRSMVLTDFKH